jgi:GTPase SAR1 family protein
MPNALQAHAVAKHKFLVLGDTGSGKTSQILTLLGKKFIYLFDPNAINSLEGFDVDYEEFLPDALNMSAQSLSKDKGDKTTNHQNQMYLEWEKDFDERMKDGFFDQYDVIGLDSATTFQDLIMDRVLTINGRAGKWPQQDDYGPQMQVFTQVMRTLNSLGKTIYVTGHMETRQDELTKKIYRSPLMTGRLKTKIPLLFSDIFTTAAENDGKGGISYTIQTVPDRMTSTIRTSFKNLEPFEDVTIDWSKPVVGQGIGGLIEEEQRSIKK